MEKKTGRIISRHEIPQKFSKSNSTKKSQQSLTDLCTHVDWRAAVCRNRVTF